MPTKLLLLVTAALETPTGAALLVRPSLPVFLLFGSTLDTPAAQALGRVAGAALLAIGLACWKARNDEGSPAGRGLVCALLLYNLATATILTVGGLGSGLSGIGLWPAAALHGALAFWCIAGLRKPRFN